MLPEQRKQIRTRRGELRTLVNEWDPAGRIAAGAPRDAYDRLVDTLFSLFSRSVSESDVAAFLEREVRAQFGGSAPDAARFAAKLLAWYRMSSGEAR